MGAWHIPLVLVYLLQHPDDAEPRFLDGQFRVLQLFCERGLEAVGAFARHQVARNRARAAYDMRPLEPFAPLPAARPAAFPLGVHDLLAPDGTFVGDGTAAYGRRMTAVAVGTVAAYLGAAEG